MASRRSRFHTPRSGAAMDAVRRLRHQAYDYGYLLSNPQVIVRSGPFIEILPVDPGFFVVPYYRPTVVFAASRPGFWSLVRFASALTCAWA